LFEHPVKARAAHIKAQRSESNRDMNPPNRHLQHKEPSRQSALLWQAHSPHLPPMQHWPAVQSAAAVHGQLPHEPSGRQHLPAVQSLFCWQAHSPHLPSA
jgi:hypothetical protein